MKPGITPLIDFCGPPPPTPLDVLLAEDTDSALAEAFRQAACYRAALLAACDQLHEGRKENVRLRERLIAAIEDNRALRARSREAA
jgi:hypothetical protein